MTEYIPARDEITLTALLVNGADLDDLTRAESVQEMGRKRVEWIIEHVAENGAGWDVQPDGWQRIEEALVAAFRVGVHEALGERRRFIED